MKKCSICGKYFEGFGNNAQPVNDGRCCDLCNEIVVTPRRIRDIQNHLQIRNREELENG